MKKVKNKITQHAEERRQKRGIAKWAINFVKTQYDKCQTRYGKTIAISISKKKLKELRKYGEITADQLEKLLGVTLIQSLDNHIVTVYYERKN